MERKGARWEIGIAMEALRLGATLGDVCEELNVSRRELLKWLKQYGGCPKEEVEFLEKGREEMRRLKRALAEVSLEKRVLQTALLESVPYVTSKRELVNTAKQKFAISERRACTILGVPRSSNRYHSRRTDVADVERRILDLARAHPKFGYRRIHNRLLEEGYKIGLRRTYQLYRRAGLKKGLTRRLTLGHLSDETHNRGP